MSDLEDHDLHIPIIEEAVTVDKIAVKSDAVRIHTDVDERKVVVEDIVQRETLNIKRFPMDQAVQVAPPPREDGNVTIISLVEERLVVEKRLFVIEEIHVTRERTQERVAIPVTLRATRARVERPSSPTSKGSITNG